MKNELQEYIDFIKTAEIVRPKYCGGIFMCPDADLQVKQVQETIILPGKQTLIKGE